MPSLNFKDEYPFEKRRQESERIINKYNDRIPVIVHRHPKSTNVPEMEKKKFLVPNELTNAQFLSVIRKRVNLAPEQAIFVFIKDTLAPAHVTLKELYSEHKDEDGFLYMTYSGENTFGSL
eukprot:JP437690.1.p1 GENE.JP437690.1~~JP437690.1.p1  ORF type:complete len:121 (-),score=40.27 JP437690.1:156-518(-)